MLFRSAAIFEAHLAMLEDPELLSQTQDHIRTEKVNAEYSFKIIADRFVVLFEQMEDEYMKARAADVRDVASTDRERQVLELSPGRAARVNAAGRPHARRRRDLRAPEGSPCGCGISVRLRAQAADSGMREVSRPPG